MKDDMSVMTPGDSIVKGLKVVAAYFGKSLRQVQRWAREPNFPRLSGRRFDLHQVQAWLDAKQGIPPATRSPSHQADPRQPVLPEEQGKDFWDKQGKKFQAQMRELELRQRRGELVERKEVEQLFVARIIACKAGLLSLSRALPPQLAICQSEREMEPIIARAVRDLLLVFSRPLPENIGGDGGSSGGAKWEEDSLGGPSSELRDSGQVENEPAPGP